MREPAWNTFSPLASSTGRPLIRSFSISLAASATDVLAVTVMTGLVMI